MQQAIQLLSEAPGNIVYHLVTLFALQVVFALSVNQWQRDRTDRLALRAAWAAGAIFLARAGLLLAGVVYQGNVATAVAAIAPIEQAVHTITILFLIWSFVPPSTRFPQLGNVLLGLAVVSTGVMTLSFVQTWQSQAAAGEAYNSTQQATIWGIVQLVVLGLGLVYLLQQGRLRFSLPVIIIGLLFLAHVAHFWNYPEILPTTTDVPYWIRLGHFIVLPLWAAWAYRHMVTPLLAAHEQPAMVQVARSLDLATEVISTLELETAVSHAVDMAARMTGATFAGVALSQEDNPKQLHLTCTRGQSVQLSGAEKAHSWFLNLEDWPSFRQVLAEKTAITLKPEGMGARQLRDWYQEMGVTPLGPLFIQPLIVQQDVLGLLLLAGPDDRTEWTEAEQVLARAVAGYVARAMDNGRYLSRAAQMSTAPVLLEDTQAVSGRIVALEEERIRLKAELDTTVSRLQQAEMRAVTANKQARDLAATLAEMEQINRSEQVEALEMEVEALRESLIEAEEAMALAAASEGELSTEWVMHTITRYSGQLEEAQERIESLETALAEYGQGPVSEVVVSLVQELRTPMTSIVGYTEILLAERVGILGVRQREFVQRVQANTARLGVLLDQLVQLTTTSGPLPSRIVESETDVEEVIDTAVNTVLNQIREKNLRLELKISPNMPLLPVNHNDLRQIVTSLLDNACQSSIMDSCVCLNASAGNIPPPYHSENGHGDQFNFLHLAVTDSGGGIRVEDRPRVFDPHHDADSPLIVGLGDTGASLSVARMLAEANGGRLWVDSMMGTGSTFSAVFPLFVDQTNGETAVAGKSEGV
ncbi:MAG: GAF domain-containing protein [Ardenticatenaceae bacterium]|nr:GAF domain-containing protein [Ardenticatenaceae bacterium]MCB9443519.1 GAF domain-containing protein [Ardenticatenaceae bacterium]